jgi:hypothetical protein
MSFVFVLATTMLAAIAAFAPFVGQAQHKKEVVWSADEKPIADQIHGLRALPDDVRAGTTKDLALKIRNLPPTENKLRLAEGLAGLSTEGDFGHDALRKWRRLWLRLCVNGQCIGYSQKRTRARAPRDNQLLRMLNWPPWCGTSMWRRFPLTMTRVSFVPPWRDWKPMTTSGSIPTLH